MSTKESGGVAALECCPTLEPCDVCDVLDFRFRLPFKPVTPGTTRVPIPVIVILHFRLTRCAGPLALGDILYSTTLLPGEQVRLFTSDRHSRFSFDSETQLSYRQHTTSEESFFMAGMANAVNNVNVNEHGSATSSFHNSATSGGGGLGIDLFGISLGGSVSGSSYDAKSTSAFARSLSSHADSSSRHVEVATRAASSTSVGEVSTRAHSEGQSEDQYESSSRVFSNANRCHALTFLFYKLNKCQIVRWELVGIERHVLDPAAPTHIELNDPPPSNGVAVIPDGILATSKERPETERRAQASVAERQLADVAFARQTRFSFAAGTAAAEPVSDTARAAALAEVDKHLVAEGLLTKDGAVAERAKTLLGWEREIALPTAGVIVKGCLDECDVCEPALEREIELELEHKQLENELLKKQIDLLEKSQEYRCCPDGDEDETPEP
jgi:hypothetical protein